MAPAELDIVNSEAIGQAVALPAWIQSNLDLVIGVPLRILLIVVGALILRALARRAISRLVERVLRSGEGRNGQSRFARGPAVLQRDPSRADERRQQRARTLGSVLSSFATIVIVVTALAMVLGEVGIALGPLLASAGVVGLAIGFGAQSLVADYLSGLLIMAEDQFGVGDVVDLGEAVGEVESVGLRITQVRDINGGLWYIRNGEIQRVRNDSQDWARAVLDVSVAYESNLERVYEVLERAGREMREDPEFGKFLLEDPTVWGVQSLDADGVVVRLAAKTVPLEQWGVTRELRRRVKAALDSSGIEIPFPQRTVWMKSGDGSAA
ncbi:mechanosensitive ion channel family protein [Nocardiopsis aegyptia]|uniref:Small conductance mechanosensitive channel n=1 Tax=Nocardiopsis aegyptia TaxID=220378 RepID=A0A7Z0JB72_9ACTN|nr:mechanosensitive ion channel family protein [Nocardiopsis aegyptia]NYJ36033.1 small conductance mechanosensitive channel [Nocardiopsis aegyptia]